MFMFTRKPKNIVRDVMDLTNSTSAQETSHTWMSGNEDRVARFGSTSRETFQDRRQVDRERKIISRYADSRIATSATSARGDLTRASRNERESEVLKEEVPTLPQSASMPTPPPERNFYPDFRPRL